MQETLSLFNICRGAADEVFQRELERLVENIQDINTDEKAKRKIALEFTFEPYPDRSGAVVNFNIKSSMPSLKPVGGTIHISKMSGKVAVYPFDPRQEAMFEQPKGPTQ